MSRTARRLVIVALAILAALAVHHAVKAWITSTLKEMP